jgi:hypothetical protein
MLGPGVRMAWLHKASPVLEILLSCKRCIERSRDGADRGSQSRERVRGPDCRATLADVLDMIESTIPEANRPAASSVNA